MADLTIKRGRTVTLRTAVSPAAVATGSTILFTAKLFRTNADADAILNKSLGDGIVVDDPGSETTPAILATTIDPEDTRVLANKSVTLYYEFKIVKNASAYTVDEGTIIVTQEIRISDS